MLGKDLFDLEILREAGVFVIHGDGVPRLPDYYDNDRPA